MSWAFDRKNYTRIKSNDINYLNSRRILKSILLNFLSFLNDKDRALKAGYNEYKHYRRYSGWWGSLTDYWCIRLDDCNYLRAEFLQQVGHIEPFAGQKYHTIYNVYDLHEFKAYYVGKTMFETRAEPFCKRFMPWIKLDRKFFDDFKSFSHCLFDVRIPTNEKLNNKKYKPYDIVNTMWKDVVECVRILPFVYGDTKGDTNSLYIRSEITAEGTDYSRGIHVYNTKGFDMKQFTLFNTLLRAFMEDPKTTHLFDVTK